jgi:hypothetical protein
MAAISVQIEQLRGWATITLRGNVSKTDAITALDLLYQDPQFNAGMSELWDLRNAQAILSPVELTEIISFVSQHTERRGKGRTAVVAGRDVDYGMARIAQVHVEELDIELMVFRALDEAERWLEGEGEYRPQFPAAGQSEGSGSKAG